MPFNPDEYLKKEKAKPASDTAGFDPDAYLSDTQNADTTPAEGSESSQGFDPDAYLSESSGAHPREAELTEKGEIAQDEIQAIAAQTGADPKELADIAPLYGLFPEGEEKNYVRRAAGFVDRAIPQGLGTFAYKKLQDEKTRKAFDQLAAIAERRRSTAETVAEVGTGIATALGSGKMALDGMKAAGVGAKEAAAAMGAYDIASMFGGGAAAGVATSEEGEELKGALTGAAFGAAFLGLGKVAQKLAGRAGRKGAEEIAESLTDVSGEVEKKLAEKAPYLAQAEKDLVNSIKSGMVPTRTPDVNVVKHYPVTEALTPEAREEAVKALGLKRLTRNLTPEETDRVIKFRQDRDALHGDIREFASYLTKAKKSAQGAIEEAAEELGEAGAKKATKAEQTTSEALATIRDRIGQEGGEHILGEWRRFQAGKAAIEALGDKLAQKLPREASIGRKALRFIQDGRAVAAQIDNRIGTRLEPWMDAVAKNQNAFTIELSNAFKKAKPALDATNAANLRELTPEALSYLESTGDLARLSPEQQKAMKGFSDLMESWRLRANELGLPIAAINPEKAKLYIPRAQVDAATTVQRIKERAQALGIPTDRPLREGEFRTLESKGGRRFLELKEALAWTTNETKFEDADSLGRALQQAMNPGAVSDRLVSRASAAAARAEEGVPNLLRETDLNRLAAKWLYNTFHHAYFREPLAELAKQENLARAAKDLDAADFIHKLRLDMTGGRKGTFKRAYENAKVRMQVRAKEIEAHALKRGDRVTAGAAALIGDSPEVINLLMGQVYPNFLGLSPRAILQNLTQTYFMTIPELGYKYGAPKVLKAQMKAAAQVMSGSAESFTRGRGHLPEQSYNRLMDTLAHNMKASEAYRMTEGAVNKFTNFAMKGFEISEQFNRAVALNVAEDVAKDLMQVGGSKGAQKFLNEMSRGYRDEIKKAVSSGNEKKVQELLENYLIGKTVFNYNRATMAEFGRSLGPFFSVFSKWPAAIAGDVITQMEQRGAFKGSQEVMRKYLAPLAAATMLTSFLELKGDDNPRSAALLGKEGLAQAAPIRSLSGILEGDIFQPPAVQLALKTVKMLINMDPNEGWKVLNEAVQAYVPGAVLLRIIGKDLPQLMKNEDPDQSTLIGRAVEAVNPRIDLDERIRDRIGRGK